MSNRRILAIALVTGLTVVILFQFQTIHHLRNQLAQLDQENKTAHQGVHEQGPISASTEPRPASDGAEQTAQAQEKKFSDLESEVIRLRGVAGRAVRAESEAAQLKSALESRQATSTAASIDGNSNQFSAYLGEVVQPPANINPSYTKEGLLNAVQQAAQLAGVPLKKVEIETSEFPFLLGVVCDSDEDFEKIKAQFKNMSAYQYGGSTSSHGTYAFSITLYSSYPSEAEHMMRRIMLRQQIFFNQLSGQ